jgi:hypothetical protein
VEGYLDLRLSSGGGRDTGKVELTQLMIVLGQRSFSLEYLDGYCLLVVLVGGEGLGLLGRYFGVSRNDLGHYSSYGLNSHSKRDYIQKNNSGVEGLIITKHSSLNSSSISNSLIRVDESVRLLTIEVLLKHLLDLRDTGGSSNKYNVINFRRLFLGVLEGFLDWGQGLLEKISIQLLEFGSGEGLFKVKVLKEVLNFNGVLVGGGKSSLGSLNFLLEFLN